MQHRARLRSARWAALFIGSQLFCARPSAASPTTASDSSELRTARAAVRRLLQLGERAESQQGGSIAQARRRAETSSAQTTSAWLDWLPDFSLAVRRQIEQETDTELSTPRWRFDLEGRVALSLPKVRAIGVARAAHEKAQAELAQAADVTRINTLEAGLDLYFYERRAALLNDQLSALESLASAMSQSAAKGGSDDRVLLEGYLGELRGKLAQVEFERRAAAQDLAAKLQVSLDDSGIDPRLDLPLLLALVRSECGDTLAHVARVHRADIELQEQRLRWTESQSWYVPELRSTTLALLPRGSEAEPNGSASHTTNVTTEFALGLRLLPGIPAWQAAQRHAVAKSRFDEEQSRWLRAQTDDRARARLGELSRAWLEDESAGVARAVFDDAAGRFARGERTVAELAAANRTLLAALLRREQLLEGAIRARISISGDQRSDLAPTSEPRRTELQSTDVDQRLRRSLWRSPALRSAHAEAARATERARSERFLLSTALEGGLLVPLYESGNLALPVRSEASLSGSGSLATVVREASVLGRWSLDLRPTQASERAVQSEARLRQAQLELERKKYQWAELEARLELAAARKASELSERTWQFAVDAWQSERRWFEQGAANAEDVRTAELARDAARVTRAEAEARKRSAASALGSYLAAERGTQLDVDESPEALELWATQHFIPDNQLRGFESVERRREAKLEAEFTRARTKALSTPSRGTTLTAQAVQGLRGGAFSFTFALSVSLDSARDAGQIARAAEREGRARGRALALERELNEQRARLSQQFEEANALLATEAQIQRRLTELGDALRREQAAAPDVHPALKQRQLDAVQAAKFDSEKRQLAVEEQRRNALIRSLALGNPLSPSQGTNAPSTLLATRGALTQQAPGVAAADAAASEVRAHRPIPVASALHPVGPFAVGSYSANRVVGPSSTKTWRGDFGLGLSLGLDESISFLATQQLSSSADSEQRAARHTAALRALHELGLAWTARELSRASAEEEAEALRQLADSVRPRFELGQVGAATLLEAQQRHALSLLRHSSDESLLRTQRALLAALGASVSDAVLDEYRNRALVYSSKLPPTAPALGAVDPAVLAAEERSAAASSETVGSALRSLSPITGLIESRPAQFRTTTGVEQARESSTGHELLWVFSLIVPFKPKEFGALALASARAGESDEELAAARRTYQLRCSGLQARLDALREQQAAASARTAAAQRAVVELDRRLRNAQDHSTIDDVNTARSALFEARRAQILVDGSVLEAALLLELEKENR